MPTLLIGFSGVDVVLVVLVAQGRVKAVLVLGLALHTEVVAGSSVSQARVGSQYQPCRH